jgi:hypothetical protein
VTAKFPLRLQKMESGTPVRQCTPASTGAKIQSGIGI